MNLIELENLVKGAPDEYLVKEVQQPTGKVPPFLALSEIQRRKDMRDRYMAQKNEGAKPTIAEQLTGGIGSLGGEQAPQGAPIPTPSATGIPSAGAPPVAAGAAPMPTPPGIPQGFAQGGLVKMAEAGVVPRGSEVQRRKQFKDYEYNFLDEFRKQSPEYYNAIQGAVDVPLGAYYQANNMLNAVGNYPIELIDSIRKNGIRNTGNIYNTYEPDPRDQQSASSAFEPLSKKLKARDAEKLAQANAVPAAPLPEYLKAPGAGPALAKASPEPVPRPAYAVTPGGIGSIDPNQTVSGGAGVAPAVGVPGPAQTAVAGAPGIPNPYNISPEELELQQYLRNEENFKLPEALSYQAFIDEAIGEEQKIREEAKKQAIGAALVQLGAGLAMGDMAKGFTTAGAESRDILSQGRKEASAQKALAQQFKLQGMQGERDAKLKQMEMDIKRTESLATLVGGNRRDAESRAMDIARMQQDAAQHAASIGIQSAQLGLSRERADLERKQGAVQFMESLIDTSIGKPPSQASLEEWATAKRTNPATAGPNPMDTYMAQRAAAAKLAAPKVEEVYGIPAQNLYIDAVKPVSNPGASNSSRFKVEPYK